MTQAEPIILHLYSNHMTQVRLETLARISFLLIDLLGLTQENKYHIFPSLLSPNCLKEEVNMQSEEKEPQSLGHLSPCLQ